ncbi:MAG: polysaccharide biosynthesis/export family protein [Cyclobacteriaceae bacterium]|nr:polysaccharide biosynthesis/export family protein [Cyclobacteriaceae bacterium]
MLRPTLLVLSCLLLLASCVTNKQVTLMQKNDLFKQDLKLNEVTRTYELDSFRYKIQTNDILYIRFESLTPKEFDFFSGQTPQQNLNVMGNALFFGELVNEKGEIPFPVIGKVKVAGLTIFETQEYFRKLASQYIDAPMVKVRLANYRVTLLGEVMKEGTIQLGNNRTSMLEAIGLAGGLGELADRSHLKLIRQWNGKTEVVYLNLLDEEFMRSPYYYVHQNDIVIVPPLKQRTFRKYFSQNLALVFSALSLALLVALNLKK